MIFAVLMRPPSPSCLPALPAMIQVAAKLKIAGVGAIYLAASGEQVRCGAGGRRLGGRAAGAAAAAAPPPPHSSWEAWVVGGPGGGAPSGAALAHRSNVHSTAPDGGGGCSGMGGRRRRGSCCQRLWAWQGGGVTLALAVAASRGHPAAGWQ